LIVLGGIFLQFRKKSDVNCCSFFITHSNSKLKKKAVSIFYSTLLQRNGAWFGRRMSDQSTRSGSTRGVSLLNSYTSYTT
jgi:hypothetical protein